MTLCMHFLKYHNLFSARRVKIATSCMWLFSVLMGMAVTVATYLRDGFEASDILVESQAFHIIIAIVVFPSTVIVSLCQIRLFMFSRSRINRVIPGRNCNADTVTTNFRKKHLKIAFVAGIVALAYIVSMAPLAILHFMELISISRFENSTKVALLNLAMANTIVDPYIYGLGLTQIRRVLKRQLGNIYQCN